MFRELYLRTPGADPKDTDPDKVKNRRKCKQCGYPLLEGRDESKCPFCESKNT